MQFVVTRPIRDEASPLRRQHPNRSTLVHSEAVYLSSMPPSFLTKFLKENTVPKMSFASSSALSPLDCDCTSGTPLAGGACG